MSGSFLRSNVRRRPLVKPPMPRPQPKEPVNGNRRRLLVCGDRHWTDSGYIFDKLDGLHHGSRIGVVIQGGARGADKIAADWAKARNIKCLTYDAEWNRYGHAAGPIRNAKMAEEGKPDLVVAFHSNLSQSKGTANMLQIAKQKNIPISHWDGRRKP